MTKQIDTKQASVAATFNEPVYQRLRQLHAGRPVNLLCFVKGTNVSVRDLLNTWGAKKSVYFRAKCFSEIWELPDDEATRSIFDGEIAKVDTLICGALGCLDGKYSAATGNLLWGDSQYARPRRHFTCRLLVESRNNIRAK